MKGVEGQGTGKIHTTYLIHREDFFLFIFFFYRKWTYNNIPQHTHSSFPFNVIIIMIMKNHHHDKCYQYIIHVMIIISIIIIDIIINVIKQKSLITSPNNRENYIWIHRNKKFRSQFHACKRNTYENTIYINDLHMI